MKPIAATLLLALLLPTASIAQNSAKNPVKKAVHAKAAKTAKVEWSFDVTPSDQSPSTVIFLKVGGKKVRIMKVGNVPSELDRENAKNYQIPAGALTSCYGWWAGGGDVLYVVKKGRKLKVYHRFLEEGEEPPAPFKVVKSINL